MPLGREVDHVTGMGQAAEVVHHHPAGLQLAPVAQGLVSSEILRKGFAELQGDTSSHDPDAVDGVDQSLGVRPQNVASLELDHDRRLPG